MAGTCSKTYDITSLLSAGSERNYLVRNNGDQVKIEDLKGKVLGLYFSASWCLSCSEFTPKLIETYHDLSFQSKPFEVIFISHDKDDESFTSYFSEMPWLAIPFSNSVARERLNETFEIGRVPILIVLDTNGNVLNEKADELVRDYGSDAYPFTAERHSELNEIFEDQKSKQTIRSLLVHGELDYVISSHGDKVQVSELEGKYVGLYFDNSTYGYYKDFAPILYKIQQKVKQNGESFEIVAVNLDDKESSYNKICKNLPFLTIPFEDKRIDMLEEYVKVEGLPTLIIIGPDGEIISADCAATIEKLGVEAWVGFPFSQDKMAILKDKVANLEDKDKTIVVPHTLELSLLIEGEFEYVVGKDGTKVKIEDLKGKVLGLYFAASWSSSCSKFTPKLIKTYHDLSYRSKPFEVIFIAGNREDEESFNSYFSEMPWLAIPFSNSVARKRLSKTFVIGRNIPALVIIDENGDVIDVNADDLVRDYGPDAYPFTDERLSELLGKSTRQ